MKFFAGRTESIQQSFAEGKIENRIVLQFSIGRYKKLNFPYLQWKRKLWNFLISQQKKLERIVLPTFFLHLIFFSKWFYNDLSLNVNKISIRLTIMRACSFRKVYFRIVFLLIFKWFSKITIDFFSSSFCVNNSQVSPLNTYSIGDFFLNNKLEVLLSARCQCERFSIDAHWTFYWLFQLWTVFL